MHRFRSCCEVGCINVCWRAKCIDSEVVVKLGAYMFAW